MRAAAIFFLARVILAAIVGSLTRNARATSAVERPHSSLSVSATRACGAIAGWQQVKIRRSLSSAISCGAASCGEPPSGSTGSSTSSGSDRRSVAPRRARGPTRDGAPRRPRKRPRRRSLPDPPPRSRPSAEHHHRAHLDAAERRRDPLCHGDGLVEVGGLDEVVAVECLLGFGESSIGYGEAAGGVLAHGGGGTGRLKPAATAQGPGVFLGECGVLLQRPVEHLLADVGPGSLVFVDQDRVLRHIHVLSVTARPCGAPTIPTIKSRSDRQKYVSFAQEYPPTGQHLRGLEFMCEAAPAQASRGLITLGTAPRLCQSSPGTVPVPNPAGWHCRRPRGRDAVLPRGEQELRAAAIPDATLR